MGTRDCLVYCLQYPLYTALELFPQVIHKLIFVPDRCAAEKRDSQQNGHLLVSPPSKALCSIGQVGIMQWRVPQVQTQVEIIPKVIHPLFTLPVQVLSDWSLLPWCNGTSVVLRKESVAASLV